MIAQSVKLPWYKLREVVSSDDTAQSSVGLAYSDWPSADTVDLTDPGLRDISGILISAYGSDAADEDMAYKLYGRRKMNGPITLLLEGVMTLGAQVCAVDPISGEALTDTYWVDTITATGGVLSGVDAIWDSANDRQAILQVDVYGWRDLFLEINLTTMARFGAIISGVN